MFSGALFFGFLFIIGGVSLILNGLFGFNLPTMHILLALFFFYLGLSILFGKTCYTHYSWHHNHHHCSGADCYSIRKESMHIRVTDEKVQGAKPHLSFETRKGQAVIDLTPLTMTRLTQCESPLAIHTTTRAGQTVFMLNRTIPIEINASSSWGSTQFPDKSEQAFGSRVFQTHPGTLPLVVIYSEVRAGNVKFVYE
jgi:hypothetical protein